MPTLTEGEGGYWHYTVVDADKFEKFRVKDITKGVKVTLGKIKGSKRWEVQTYMFDKQAFKTKEQVRKWLDQHLKSQIQTLLDFKAWNEYRRRAVNVYMRISRVTE